MIASVIMFVVYIYACLEATLMDRVNLLAAYTV
jgi:hypothetical protein